MKPTLLLLTLIMMSCGSAKTADEKTETDTINDQPAEAAWEAREPTDDEVREFGLITDIEDGAYPMFSITVEFPEREMSLSFGFNIEDSPMTMEDLNGLSGKYATIYYLSEEDAYVYDIVRECESLLGEYAEELGDESEEITGILSGATAVSGDLPDKITITSGDGTALSFDYFITEAIVAANGDEVTVYYEKSYTNQITYLWPASND
jgi:hypothetical protein